MLQEDMNLPQCSTEVFPGGGHVAPQAVDVLLAPGQPCAHPAHALVDPPNVLGRGETILGHCRALHGSHAKAEGLLVHPAVGRVEELPDFLDLAVGDLHACEPLPHLGLAIAHGLKVVFPGQQLRARPERVPEDPPEEPDVLLLVRLLLRRRKVLVLFEPVERARDDHCGDEVAQDKIHHHDDEDREEHGGGGVVLRRPHKVHPVVHRGDVEEREHRYGDGRKGLPYLPVPLD
mmetsp:Transcript_23430/g.66853  ORF Transcript_23430/g.66853 Transcript_23430/m.66853 type:complete len:233 (+) Transcript_23430:118-816(+)